MRIRARAATSLLILALATTGCAGFVAERIVAAPNRGEPAPDRRARELAPLLDALYARTDEVAIAAPPATLRYAVVEPGAYGFRTKASARDAMGYSFDWEFGAPAGWQRNPAGAAGTVVLLHGFGESSLSMLPWAFSLAQAGWRVVLLDARGHGRSSGARVGFGVYEADDLATVVGALRTRGLAPGRLALLGVSYGGHVALLAATRGLALSGVVAISGYPDPRPVIPRAARRFTTPGDWFDDDTYAEALARTTALIGRPLADAVAATGAAPRDLPLLLIQGERDAVAPLAELRPLAASWPGSELLVVPGAGHIEPALPDDARVARVVAFLDGLP